ncbi:MAG: methyl-accepting chemotaxis protein [Thermodesulfobacteriota bacterium]
MDEQRDITKELDECQRHLTQLCADIEPEFLQLGRELESVFHRAQDLSEQARGAVYLHATAHLREEGQAPASGGHLRKVIDLFLDVRDIFNTSLDALRTTIEESAKAVRHIFNIGKELESLKSGQNALERLAVITRILGISTRIECGRLGDMGSGFIFLSDQISNFSGALSKYASDFETEVKQVLANIEEAETSVAARLKIQRKESDRISQQIMGVLDMVDMASAQMTRLSEQIDHFSERILREVGEIVSALQFQDITRQQVEHVQETLTEIGCSLDGKNLKKCTSEELSIVYRNLAVQLSQLRNVRSEITTAGQNIMTALEEIGREIEGHVRHVAAAIGETSGGKGDNALAMLEPQMEALGQQLKNSFLLSEVLFKTIGNVSGLVERIGSNQAKINKTRLDMKILALNAQVQAARLGGDGRALSVLAEDMQHLSDSWSAVAEETASLLQNAVNVAADLKDKLEDVLEHCRSQTAKSQERASNAVLLLQTASDKTGSAVESINQASRSLGEDVTALGKTIKFPQLAESGLERTISHLEHLQDEIGKRLSPEERRLINGASTLDRTAERYTMESERRMHTHALQQLKPVADAPGCTDVHAVERHASARVPLEKDAQIKATGTDDMGDNVELF